jgi:hypothetical protein
MFTSGLYKSNTEHDCRACRETFSKAISDLTFQNKVLRDQVEAYKNGSKIRQLREMYEQQIRKLELKNRKLQCDNEDKDRRLKVMNDRWMEVNDDVCKERDAAVQKAQKQADAATERANQAEEKRQDLKNEYSSYRKEMEEKLKQEQKENDKLSNDLGALQVEKNRNFKNSSKPSSTDPNHVKVYNTRKKSGLKPGGQPGHIFHGRQMQKPTDIQWIDPPDKFLDPLQYRMTGRVIRKQEVGIEIIVTCTEYRTPEFRKLDTGQRVHAGFPHGLKDDVTYDGSIKALAYLLNQEMNVSIGKTAKFINEITDGKLKLSEGLVCSLSHQFSKKTKGKRRKIFRAIHTASTAHADFTFTRANGKTATILICASGNDVLYQVKKKKGDQGTKNSPLVNYKGTLTTDHEAAFVKVTSKHQECLIHALRHDRATIENEPDSIWAVKMEKWIVDALAYWNEVHKPDGQPDPKRTKELLNEYDSIIELAGKEYANGIPKKYFRDGYNLYKRMRDKKEDYVRFLHNMEVCPQNNLCERRARVVKRKGHAVITFRSDDGLIWYCNGQSVLESAKAAGMNLYDYVSKVFWDPEAGLAAVRK